MHTPEQIYLGRQSRFDRLRAEQQRANDRLSNYRLGCFLLGLVAALATYRFIRPDLGVAIGLATLALLVLLAVRHGQIRQRLRQTEALRQLNRRGLARLHGDWAAFSDTGAEFADEDHPYASDLDLFGPGSLFQWTSSAITPLGRQALAEWLRQPPTDLAEVEARQIALQELAENLDWRQRLEAEGMLVADKFAAPQPLLRWAQAAEQLSAGMRLAVRALPVITILTVLLNALHLWVPWPVPVLLILLHLALLRSDSRRRGEMLTTVYRHEASLSTYAVLLQQIEALSVNSPWLQARQQKLRDAQGQSAGEQIRRLSRIVESISNRRNILFVIINVLALWDYQCQIALEDWKRRSGRLLGTWLEVIAAIEALASLANIRFDHPDWAFPGLATSPAEASCSFSARALGHPLLGESRVVNDFTLSAPTRVALITGSNMSGKSTWLRTVGSNLVLAYAGAPVCAEQFQAPLVRLWTSMRVSDNLQQSISSFYAELLRVKRIVSAAKAEPPVCFLLDEIFKGTNSEDRHQGAKALINQLLRDGAFGLVSTHDLELGELEQSSHGQVKNYHFREYYQGDEIRFDYRLRPGISTTRNARHLIRLAGIELDEPSQ